MFRTTLLSCCFGFSAAFLGAQLAPDVAPFVSVNSPVVVLNHVRIIDGTGSAPKDDQAVVIARGNIQSIGPAGSTQPPANAQVLDRTGYSVIPGLVGMHDHLYYTDSASVQMGSPGGLSEPRPVCRRNPIHRAATLPCCWSDHHANDGQRGALH